MVQDLKVVSSTSLEVPFSLAVWGVACTESVATCFVITDGTLVTWWRVMARFSDCECENREDDDDRDEELDCR